MPNPARDDKELTSLHLHRTTIALGATDAKSATKYEKHLIFVFVGVPWELSADTHGFDVLIIHLTDDAGRP